MASIISSEASPLWTRISYDVNASLPDSAIFYTGSDGSIEVRVCQGDGRVEYTCDCCDCDDDSSYDSSYSGSSYGGYAKSEPIMIGLTNTSKKFGGKKNNKNFGEKHTRVSRRKGKTAASPVRPPSSSSSSFSSSSRRYSSPEQVCSCGHTFDWSSCPHVALGEAFHEADIHTNCQDFLKTLHEVHTYNLIWVIVGMIVPLFVSPFIFFFITSSWKYRKPYLLPLVGQVYCLIFGAAVHCGLFYCCFMVAEKSKALFSERGKNAAPQTTFNSCGIRSSGPPGSSSLLSLYDNNFRDKAIDSIWNSAVAGCVFTAIPAGVCVIGCLFTFFFPSPRNFSSNYQTSCFYSSSSRYSSNFEASYPDYENEPPHNGATEVSFETEQELREKATSRGYAERRASLLSLPRLEMLDSNNNNNNNNSYAQNNAGNSSAFPTADDYLPSNRNANNNREDLLGRPSNAAASFAYPVFTFATDEDLGPTGTKKANNPFVAL